MLDLDKHWPRFISMPFRLRMKANANEKVWLVARRADGKFMIDSGLSYRNLTALSLAELATTFEPDIPDEDRPRANRLATVELKQRALEKRIESLESRKRKS